MYVVMKPFISFLLFCVFTLTVSAQHKLTLPIIYHKDKIFVTLQTTQNDTLHFMFDTGSRDLLVDSAVAAKYHFTDKKSNNVVVPFARNIYLNGQAFYKKNLFTDTLLNGLYPWGKAVNLARLDLSSDIKIDGIIGISEHLENHTVLIDFVNNTLTIASSVINSNLKNISHSVTMLYSDDGSESKRSELFRVFPANKFNGYYKGGHTINTNLIFDTGCHWETAIVTIFDSDSLFTNKDIHNKRKPTKYHDKKEKIDYWIADSITIANKITLKNIKTVYLKAYSGPTFGNLSVGILLGAPFFKRYKQVYFNFPAKRIDFVQ